MNKGSYSVSAWVEIDPTLESVEKFPRGKRETTISAAVSGSPAVSNTVNSSTLFNTVAADQKNRTYAQRVRVLIDVLADGDKPVLTISAGAGTTAVLVDDIRVVKTAKVSSSDVVSGDRAQRSWPSRKTLKTSTRAGTVRQGQRWRRHRPAHPPGADPRTLHAEGLERQGHG
ncbi:hypothetical protein [Arthrobacter psychrolactophilus]